ncbi:MAG TPA: PQQ-dependent sugar dehydrogenase, partial [Thermomicrobiales bacterium]|nr:PQQ-dependent sugar dehydrogenase [Thermomicrobiales bacterium]
PDEPLLLVRELRKERAVTMRVGRGLMLVVLLVVSLLSVAGAGAERQPLAHDPDDPPVIVLEPVLRGLFGPVYVTHADDGSGRLFVVERGGAIRVARDGELLPQPFLDLHGISHTDGDKQGLLGMAFHPDYAENGYVYVAFTDSEGTNIVNRYQRSSDNPDRADPDSATTILAIPDRLADHNLGMLAFGPDGYLYTSIGDEGTSDAGDPYGHAQNLSTLFGSVLRLDVDSAEPYAIPPDNPFVGVEGAREEIWAIGLRSPWRFSFDRQTGDLFVADVGQSGYEEVNYQPADSPGGENYGWSIMEGPDCYPAGQECDTEGLTMPVHAYDHSVGCSITGGYVYRGVESPLLAGDYLFADFCSGRIYSLARGDDGEWDRSLLLSTNLYISSFGEDEAGELYVADMRSGSVFRIVALEQAPEPVIEGLSQASAQAGDEGFTLHVNGRGFVPESLVEWDGLTRATTFLDSTHLMVEISAVDLRLAGMCAVRVINPDPGGASVSASFEIATPAIGHQSFTRTWQRTDAPVANGAVERTWMWGPEPFSAAFMEEYADSDGGQRLVQYFDKSRMEITNPEAFDDGVWYVTNGLLARELMTGKRQGGNDEYTVLVPAEIGVAGDPNDANAPTYATFGTLMGEPALATGTIVMQTVDRDGAIASDQSLAAYGVTAATIVPETGHAVATVFWELMLSVGIVDDGEALTTDRLFLDPFYATGLPLTEAYWTTVSVAGQPQLVLVQAFERRVMTWTPSNPIGWQVEAGNVGRHYYEWRYGT